MRGPGVVGEHGFPMAPICLDIPLTPAMLSSPGARGKKMALSGPGIYLSPGGSDWGNGQGS